MAETLENFSEFLSNENFSLVVLLGDRFEILAAASAALVHNIPVAHIGGGEISEGAIDDSIRHALTKMSRLHFVITEQCARRVIRMGEAPETVFTVGSPRLDYISGMKFKSKEELERSAGIEFSEKNALVIGHPGRCRNQDGQPSGCSRKY
jgi:UDP-hydrolysing UDP-N-acetyl-D-glucosamine 2-epimerase